MNAIIIDRHLIDSEKEVIRQSNTKVLATNEDYTAGLGCNFETLNITEDIKNKVNKDLAQYFTNFNDIIAGNQPVRHYLRILDIDFWHIHKFRLYLKIRSIYYLIEVISRTSKDSEHLNIYTNNSYLHSHFSNDDTIEIFPGRPIHSSNKSIVSVLRFAAILFYRALAGLFQSARIRNKKNIILDRSQKQTCINYQTLKPEQGNYNLAYLIANADKNDFVIINELEPPKDLRSLSWKNANLKNVYPLKLCFGEFILLKGIFNYTTILRTKKAYKKLEASCIKLAAYNLNDPLFQLTVSEFRSLIKPSRYFLFKHCAYHSYFKKLSSLKSIISIDENSPAVRTVFEAAKKENKTTIGIQHGNIYDLLLSYRYSSEDMHTQPIPDKTMVWGNYFKDFLISECNYIPESVYAIGQLRTDIIPKLLDPTLHEEMNNRKSKNTILFASQPQPDSQLRKQAAIDILQAAKLIQDCELVIKLHPAEKDGFTYYNDLAASIGTKNYTINNSTDLYLLIVQSTIVATCYSTVGNEAIYFNKPLIILDHLKKDMVGFKKRGVAFQVSNENELIDAIKDIFDKKIGINKMNYEQFITDFAFSIDGKVHKRCLNIINS